MFPYQYLTPIVIISLYCIAISYCECTFQLYKDMDPRFQPVYFVKDAKKKSFTIATQKLIKTRNFIKIDESETLIITCPNQHKQQERYYEIDIFLVCGADDKLKVTKGEDKLSAKTEANEYQCRYETGFYFKKESHKSAQKLCTASGKGFNLYHIGLYANLEQKWLRKHTQEMFAMIMKRKITYMWFTLYSACLVNGLHLFDTTKIAYTYHTIDEEIVKNRQMKSTKYGDKDMRNPFGGWQSQRYMYDWYDKEKMWRAVDKNYKGKLNSYMNVENHYFVPIALVPEDIMLFSAWRYSTHLTLNNVPVWKQVSCTWKNIEIAVQLAAIRIGSTLDIYTGTYKKLVLPTSVKEMAEGKGVTVSFDYAGSFIVPAILWKLIYYKEKNEAIIFIFHNNPYRTDRPDLRKTYCVNICKKYGWPVENEIVKLGETSCCDPREFFDNDKEFDPYRKYFDIKKVLALPNSKLETDTD